MNAMRQPGAGMQPAGFLQQVHRAAAIFFEAELFLVDGLAKMRVQRRIEARGEFSRPRHQPPGH